MKYESFLFGEKKKIFDWVFPVLQVSIALWGGYFLLPSLMQSEHFEIQYFLVWYKCGIKP